MKELMLCLLLTVFLCNYRCTANEKCSDYSQHISYHNPTISYKNPSPIGVWTSSRCEIVPGPSYIIRKWTILAGKWEGEIYHYADSWCTQPTFTSSVEGSYEMYAATATPAAKASQACNFTFDVLKFSTKNSTELEKIVSFIRNKCIDAIPLLRSVDNDQLDLSLFLGKPVKLEKAAASKKHCRYFFGFHKSAYKKIRIVGQRRTENNRNDILYFSDIPPKWQAGSHSYVGPGFQYGLFRVDRPDCPVCKLVKKEIHPILPPSDLSQDFTGGWISTICEAVNDNTFQTRYFQFRPSRKEIGRVDVALNVYRFLDANCVFKRLTIKAKGRVTNMQTHDTVEGILRLEIRVERAILAAYDGPTLSMMRQPDNRCGDRDKWKHGNEQDVSSTQGCSVLDLQVPKDTAMNIRVVQRGRSKELYIQDDETQGTFFTGYLVPCHAKNITKMTTTPKPTHPPVRTVPQEDFTPRNGVVFENLPPGSNSYAIQLNTALLATSTILVFLFSL